MAVIADAVRVVAAARDQEEERRARVYAHRRLLAWSDNLLEQAEVANRDGGLLRPSFGLDLARLARDISPDLVEPTPATLSYQHLRLGLLVRGWEPWELAAAAGVGKRTVERAVEGNYVGLDAERALCAALARPPAELIAVSSTKPVDPLKAHDLVFELQSVLFGQMREAGELVPAGPEDEVLTEAQVALIRRACVWIGARGRVRTAEMPDWIERLIDQLAEYGVARQLTAGIWCLASGWQEALARLEREASGIVGASEDA